MKIINSANLLKKEKTPNFVFEKKRSYDFLSGIVRKIGKKQVSVYPVKTCL